MNKTAIKNYAIWARVQLIESAKQRAFEYEITDGGENKSNAETVGGRPLSADEKRQRNELIGHIRHKGYAQVMEEVAYTWFNRFIALRFMEVNGYLPSKVRVFTDENNAFKPEILKEALRVELDGLDRKKVLNLLDKQDNEELYKYLIITQCNALSEALPVMFEKISNWTELIFPANLLRQDSVLGKMISMIPEEDWKDAVQIIGWLYESYNIEKNELVYDGNMSKSRIPKELLPAATTIFTPDWPIRYMVENSLGRLWVEGHPNDELKAGWKYYLEEAEQEPEVQAQLAEIRKEYAALKPEEIKVIDPCMGSGHILVYMFDVLVQIYEAYGYNAREAAGLILQNNLYGLDIDDRAAQLAYFAVMMKARQYDRRIFSRGIQPHVYAITESNSISRDVIEYFEDGRADLKNALDTIIAEMNDAKEYGSIINVTQVDFASLYDRIDEIKEDISLFANAVQTELLPLIVVAEVMAQKYHTIVTNPPYLGFNRFNAKLSEYVGIHYADVKSDLASVMFKRALEGMCCTNGFVSFITTSSWLFLSSFADFRQQLIKRYSFDSIVDYGSELFDGKVGHNQIISWVTRKSKLDKRLSAVRLVDYCYARRDEKEPEFFNEKNRHYILQSSFDKLPGNTISYWATDKQAKCFNMGKRVDSFAYPKQGIATADNDTYLRLWHEVNRNNAFLNCLSHDESEKSELMWYPYNKGGGYRKWYGNNEYLINWKNDGAQLRAFKKSVIRSPQYYFMECGSWCKVTSADFSMRYIPHGFLFDVAGCSLFDTSGKVKYLIGYMNSVCNKTLLALISPTLNFEVGHIASLPIIFAEDESKVSSYVDQCIELSKDEWDAFESSWDFRKHPLICDVQKISDAFVKWELECDNRFNLLKANEEELNRIFIDIYGLQDELSSDVEDRNVTIRKADLQRDIKSLISYAVGCMFGRYSLDCEGLTYAGGEWDASKYTIFPADKDNIIPICDDDYFDDDITGRFIKWIETVYGSTSLESNLKFIADALGGKGTPREIIRKYFLNDFYADHLKIYQKRPIYWLFDSGKKNGFKALVYMHRYQPDLLARMRTDYVHEQQERYRTQIQMLEDSVQSASPSERVKLNKQIAKLKDQALEVQQYEEKIHHLADQMISIDLDDGVKVNYAKFQDVLERIK